MNLDLKTHDLTCKGEEFTLIHKKHLLNSKAFRRIRGTLRRNGSAKDYRRFEAQKYMMMCDECLCYVGYFWLPGMN